jgi:hypothetical protein
MSNALLPITKITPARQLVMALETVQTNGLGLPERRAVIARLARLLMEAAGVEIEESADDGR